MREDDEIENEARQEQENTETLEIPRVTPGPTHEQRLTADAIKLAFNEMQPSMKRFIREVMSEERADEELEDFGPEVAYDHRRHVIQFLEHATIGILTFVGLTVLYALLAMKVFTTSIGTAALVLIACAGILLGSQREEPDETAPRFILVAIKIALVLLGLVLCVVFVFVLTMYGIDWRLSTGFLVTSLATLYFTMRAHFMWSKLRFKRVSEGLVAYRPSSNIFFLPEVNERLYFSDVNTLGMKQHWLEGLLGIYRINIVIDADMPEEGDTAEAKTKYESALFWRDMRNVVNGEQLIEAIEQGKAQSRRG